MNHILLSLVLMVSSEVFAQKVKLGNITVQELEQKTDSDFPEATAVVLSRDVKVTIGRNVTVYEKIKILNKDGFDFSTITAEYLDINQIRGASYNLIDGAVIATQLTKDNIYSVKDEFGYTVTTLNFTQIKEGTIIEYSYQSDVGIMADIIIQDYLPIKKLAVEVYNTTYIPYGLTQNPSAKIEASRSKKRNTIIVNAANIPAIEPEDYVYDMNLYSGKLRLQDLDIESDYDEWEDFVGFYLSDYRFSNQLDPSRIYKDEISALVAGETDSLAMAKKVYQFVQDSIVWDQFYSNYPSRGTRSTFRNKVGDVADINILLVSTLRSLGFEAFAILSSTKGNGVPIEPNSESFNYTLASVAIGDSFYVLDAANHTANFDYIPENILNGRGMVLLAKKTYQWIDLEQINLSTLKVFNQATIEESGTIKGQTREQLTGYFARNFKKFLKDEVKFSNEIVDYDYNDLRVTKIKTDTLDVKELATLNYDFYTDDSIEIKEDRIYLEPLLFLSLAENPFIKDERNFPIDYGYAQQREYLFTFNYPESYTIDFIPDSINIVLPNDLGRYSYQISPVEGVLQVRMQMSINTAVLPVDFYAQLKEFYQIRVSKENEKVVLVKRK
ncbi:MAG: transglutaminase domain-containing protein [Gilvibacter sp.]